MAHLPSGGDFIVTTTGNSRVLLIVLVSLLAARFLYSVWLYPIYLSPLRHLPKPKDKAWPIFGHLPKFIKGSWIPHIFHEWSLSNPDGPFIRYLGFGNAECLMVNNVAAYHEVLQMKYSSFVKPSGTRKCAEGVFGNGLPFAEGHAHRHRRGILNKFFSVATVRSFMPVLNTKARSLVDVMEANKNLSGEVEVESLIWKAVLDVIGIKVLGVDLNHLTSSQSNLHSLFSATTQQSLVSHIFQYFSGYLPLRHLVPAKFNRQFFNDCESVRRIIRDHVSRGDPNRKMGDDYVEEEGATQDLILTLIEKGNMSQDEVVEYVLNLMVLGHDTTACSLAWAVHRLTQNPACQDRLRSEIHKFNNQAAAPTYGEVEGLKYLDNFLKEVLRLHCPLAYIPREAIEEVEVAGVVLPRGTVVHLCPAVINLSPSVWGPDAETFNPDRWDHLEGEAAGTYAFQTFHNGPRVCIAKQMAIMEMKVMLVELMSRFRVEAIREAVDDGAVELASPSFTLRSKEKLRVRLVEDVGNDH